MPAHKSAATSMVPCKADMVVGRCVYCLQQHPLPVVALPAARRLALQYVQPTLESLPSLLITSYEMMLVGRRSTASQIGLWGPSAFPDNCVSFGQLVRLRHTHSGGQLSEPVSQSCHRWPTISSTCRLAV